MKSQNANFIAVKPINDPIHIGIFAYFIFFTLQGLRDYVISLMIKSVHWLGRSREIIQSFTKPVRSQIGYQLQRVQEGLMPKDYKPMPSIGKGVLEIRLHKPHEHRVVYVAKFQERIHVLHAFEKKTQKTSQHDLDISRKHYQELITRMNNIR